MREIKKSQKQFGEVDIESIQFDMKSRDEIPKLLRGLQHVYCTPSLREEVFSVLEDIVPREIDTKNGRPGMELWKILVLGTIRINCNWDYDKLQEIANNHRTLRLMLGHGMVDSDYHYALQTLKDNVSLLTPDILERINTIIVEYGHRLFLKKNESLRVRADSFVVETDVHYPTDINLLFDALRKTLTLVSRLSKEDDLTFWRQWKSTLKKIKKQYRHILRMKRSTSRNAAKQARRENEIKKAHTTYCKLAKKYLVDAQGTLDYFLCFHGVHEKAIKEIEYYLNAGHTLIDQIHRRVVKGEKIPHNEKIFSLFEPHTEWICKGKAGVPQELGVRVSIVEDQFGFILHHLVMEQQTDDKVAVPLIRKAKSMYSRISHCSFDQGFYSPSNYTALMKLVDHVAMKKKGRKTAHEREQEQCDETIEAYQSHPAVESAIHALENHGLDCCPDHGLEGFRRYVGLAVVARNLQKLGHILQQKEKKRIQRRKSPSSRLRQTNVVTLKTG